MLNFLFAVIVFIKKCTGLILICSYGTGQVIISGILVLIKTIQRAVEAILVVCDILIEDFWIFANDLNSFFETCKTIGGSLSHFITASITAIVMGIKYSVGGVILLPSSLYGFILIIFNNVFVLLRVIIQSFKQIAILIGFGIWFVITLLPFVVVSLVTMFMYYIGYAFQKTCEEIQTFFKFLQMSLSYFNLFLDFPPEAIAGLIIGMCLIFVVLRFRMFCYRLCLSRIRLRFHNQIRMVTVDVPSVNNDLQTEAPQFSSLELRSLKCSVCLDHPRNIVLLPCRHVCLCSNCDSQISQSRVRVCPICRTKVGSSMKVFI
ncbi:uncharacterized protein LOC108735599 [Agrilus planipennis]|uniref:Uncharacterized protein LOC108735599 n=1 Tax=Agrilus planipennis TaxID=224129 RepID=A0A1W4WSJ7_AGRPL|nr:uncharacterized protein LOC108735599 [Agrilus planipennis]